MCSAIYLSTICPLGHNDAREAYKKGMAETKKLTVRLTEREFRYINDLTIEFKEQSGKRPLRGAVVRAMIKAMATKKGRALVHVQLKGGGGST